MLDTNSCSRGRSNILRVADLKADIRLVVKHNIPLFLKTVEVVQLVRTEILEDGTICVSDSSKLSWSTFSDPAPTLDVCEELAAHPMINRYSNCYFL